MGLQSYDSDDDADGNEKMYLFRWVPSDGVRMHTINRVTGRSRIWELTTLFWAVLIVNVFDTDGVSLAGGFRNRGPWRALTCRL